MIPYENHNDFSEVNQIVKDCFPEASDAEVQAILREVVFAPDDYEIEYQGKKFNRAELAQKISEHICNNFAKDDPKAEYDEMIENTASIIKHTNDGYVSDDDAIEREEQKLIGEIKGPQYNNKRACCQKYYDEIENNKGRFSEETLQYAMNTYYRLLSIAGLSVQTNKENNSTNPLDLVDNMDGHIMKRVADTTALASFVSSPFSPPSPPPPPTSFTGSSISSTPS